MFSDVYLCDSCGSLFAYSYSLLAHKRHKCHAGKGEFKCEMCSKRFNFPSQLQRHMPTHTGMSYMYSRNCFALIHRNWSCFRIINYLLIDLLILIDI